MSQRTGREVYGWPKVLGKIEAEVPVWARDPRLASRVFNMNVKVFPKTFAGDHQEARPLVDIKRDSPPSLFTLPLQASNAWNPFNILSNAIGSTVDLSVEALDMLLALRIRGYRTNRSPRTLFEMTREMAGKIRGALPDLPWTPNATIMGMIKQGNVQQLGIEQVTLKQFQDAENPLDACYQAIISSTMSIDRLNAFGFLGDVNLLRGDTSGGFTVRIHRYDAQPIIDTLGIEVDDEEEADDGTKVAVIKPTLPFWTDVDLNYGKGVGLCSRIPKLTGQKNIVWRDGDLNPVESKKKDEDDPGLQRIPFNMARGAATQAIAGPFHYPDATIQIYPLMADKTSLQTCLDEYVNAAAGPSGFEFNALGSYAYLMVNVCGSQHGNMWSESNNIGSWAEREVSFCIPVKWDKKDCKCECPCKDNCTCKTVCPCKDKCQGTHVCSCEDKCKCPEQAKVNDACKCRELQSLAIVEPFVFENSGRAVLTSREINGRAAVKAEIDSPKDVWLDGSSGPDKSRRFLKLETEVFPALNLGQPTEQRTLIEIDAGDILDNTDEVAWRLVAENWGEEIVEDLLRKSAIRDEHPRALAETKAMALEMLACEQPINWINVKQYRDTDDAEIACYQALVHTTRRIADVYDIREIESRVHVRIHRYPGQPITETLGLKVKHTESRDGEVVQSLQPIRPFWMRVAYGQELGKVLCWRSSQEKELTITHPWFREPEPIDTIRQELPEEHGYFSDPGYTRLSRELVKRRPDRSSMQRTDKTEEDQIKEDLLQELKRLAKLVPSDVSKRLKRLSDQESIESTQSAEQLYEHVESAMREIGKSRPGESWQRMGATVKGQMKKGLLQELEQLVKLEPPDHLSEKLKRLSKLESIESFTNSMSAEQLYQLVEGINRELRNASESSNGIDKAKFDPETVTSRVKRSDGAQAIEKIEEIQIVIESILSDEWSHWGNPRWYRQKDAKPELCIRYDTIGSSERNQWYGRHSGTLTIVKKRWLQKTTPGE
jgi:hypothetical protein